MVWIMYFTPLSQCSGHISPGEDPVGQNAQKQTKSSPAVKQVIQSRKKTRDIQIPFQFRFSSEIYGVSPAVNFMQSGHSVEIPRKFNKNILF